MEKKIYSTYSNKIIHEPAAQFIGIDVSKSELHISHTIFQHGKGMQNYVKIANSTACIEAFLDQLTDVENVQIIFEATGVYSNRLELVLSKKGIKFSKVNGLRMKNFANSLGKLQKDDRSDARSLQLMGEKCTPPVSKPIDDQKLVKKRLIQTLSCLEKHLQGIRAQFHLLENDAVEVKIVRDIYEEMVVELEEKREKIVASLSEMAPIDVQQNLDLLQTIPGIGQKSASLLLEATTNFQGFDTAKAVVRYVGLAPVEEQSGNKRFKKGICNAAHPVLRASLYMAALSAKKHNPVAKTLFERLRQAGKPFKVAIIAVAHLLVRIAFAIVKNKKIFEIKPTT
jgi:transposase